MVRSALALVLAMSALAVASCGGGDSGSSTSATGGASGPAAATGSQKGARGKTGAPPGKSDAAGGTQSGGTPDEPKTAASQAPSAAENQPQSPKNQPQSPKNQPQSPKNQPKPYRLTEEQVKQAAPAFYQQAYQVCKAYTVKLLARDLKVDSRDPGKVAAAYASSSPAGLYKPVAAGCKKGLLEAGQ